MKMFLFASAMLVFTASNVAAQTNHWSTSAECLAATNAPFYHPSVIHRRALNPREEFIGPHATGGCLEMSLPESIGRRGWVRIEAGRPVVFDRSGKVKRLAECDNDIYAEAPFAAAPVQTRVVEAPARDSALNVSGSVDHRFPETLNVRLEGTLSEPQRTVAARQESRSWFSLRRNGKWFWPLVGGAVVVAACTIPEPRCFKVTQIVTINR